MAAEYNQQKTAVDYLSGHSLQINPRNARLSGLIRNFVRTEYGTLRSIVGPVQYHPREWDTEAEQSYAEDQDYDYPFDGLFHHVLENGRDILLSVMKKNNSVYGSTYGLWHHQGWAHSWELLVGDEANAKLRVALDSSLRPTPLAQFVALPNGVVVLFKDCRPMFYDGQTMGYLGYDKAPGPPSPLSPRPGYTTSGTSGAYAYEDDPNTLGYTHSGRNMPRAWGTARIGTLDTSRAVDVAESGKKSNPAGGVLMSSAYRYATQYIDKWGNLSPKSGLSTHATIDRMDNLTKDRKNAVSESAERLRHQLAVQGIHPGPTNTIGRIVGRTRDLNMADTAEVFEIPSHSMAGGLSFVTVPDNHTTLLPDDVPDSWLILPMMEVAPMPAATYGALAMGRLWVASWVNNRGALLGSYPGRYGTMDPTTLRYPDSKEAITGLMPVAGGLLVFTARSTYLLEPNDEGSGVRPITISQRLGCVASNTIVALPNGDVVWLSREGFVSYTANKQIEPDETSADIEPIIKSLSTTRLCRAVAVWCSRHREYRCWVTQDGYTRNNLCLVFDGLGWRDRTDIQASAVCSTNDSREYVLALGTASAVRAETEAVEELASIWVIDRTYGGTHEVAPVEHILDTHWLRASRSDIKASPQRVLFTLRETCDSSSAVYVSRDYRQYPFTHSAAKGSSQALALFPSDDPNVYWGAHVLGATKKYQTTGSSDKVSSIWQDRRMFDVAFDVSASSTSVFRVRLVGTEDIEVVSLVFTEINQHLGGLRYGKGSA